MKGCAKDDAGRTFWKPTEILKSTLYRLKVQEGDMLMSLVVCLFDSWIWLYLVNWSDFIFVSRSIRLRQTDSGRKHSLTPSSTRQRICACSTTPALAYFKHSSIKLHVNMLSDWQWQSHSRLSLTPSAIHTTVKFLLPPAPSYFPFFLWFQAEENIQVMAAIYNTKEENSSSILTHAQIASSCWAQPRNRQWSAEHSRLAQSVWHQVSHDAKQRSDLQMREKHICLLCDDCTC